MWGALLMPEPMYTEELACPFHSRQQGLAKERRWFYHKAPESSFFENR
jgi:hypothetical protein